MRTDEELDAPIDEFTVDCPTRRHGRLIHWLAGTTRS
jgi:hypothetical protein